MENLNRRNTETVQQAVKDMLKQIEEQTIRVNGLNSAMSSLMERLNQIEQMSVAQKVKLTGTGPSVKEE